jgi:hypothetical protein
MNTQAHTTTTPTPAKPVVYVTPSDQEDDRLPELAPKYKLVSGGICEVRHSEYDDGSVSVAHTYVTTCNIRVRAVRVSPKPVALVVSAPLTTDGELRRHRMPLSALKRNDTVAIAELIRACEYPTTPATQYALMAKLREYLLESVTHCIINGYALSTTPEELVA